MQGQDRTWSLQYLSNFLYQLAEKTSSFVCPFCHPTCLLLQEYTSFQASFLSLHFLANHCTLSICHYPRLRKATFNHLSHQCLFLASFTNCRMTKLLPNPQIPLFPSFPWSLCLWISSHCLPILHARDPKRAISIILLSPELPLGRMADKLWHLPSLPSCAFIILHLIPAIWCFVPAAIHPSSAAREEHVKNTHCWFRSRGRL